LPGRPEVIESVSVDTVLIEQSFSDFGDADVLVLASTPEEKVAFFCEAKRGRWWTLKKEWDEFKYRFQHPPPGGVSNVFRQLYLKQRLVQPLVAGDDLGVGDRVRRGVAADPWHPPQEDRQEQGRLQSGRQAEASPRIGVLPRAHTGAVG